MAKRKRQPANENAFQLRLKKISPLTDAQRDMFDAYREGYNLFLSGCAGTGKTFGALYLAFKDVLNQSLPYQKVIIVRSAVPSRDVGFLPGTLKQKLEVYDAPYRAILSNLFERGDAWEIATQRGIVEVVSTSFMRGITLENCVVVVDEMQNMNYQELATVATRPGDNGTKVIFCGDIVQDDLYRNKYDASGLEDFMKVVERMPSVEIIEFGPEDIVRGGMCKEFILAELGIDSTTMAHDATA